MRTLRGQRHAEQPVQTHGDDSALPPSVDFRMITLTTSRAHRWVDIVRTDLSATLDSGRPHCLLELRQRRERWRALQTASLL